MSCASTQQYVNVSNLNSAENGTAKICVLRPSLMGSAIKFKIYQDDKLIGKLGPESYLIWNVTPDGKDIKISSKSENEDILFINPQPGKIYYIKQTAKVGFFMSRTKIEFIEEQEAKESLNKLKKPTSKHAQ